MYWKIGLTKIKLPTVCLNRVLLSLIGSKRSSSAGDVGANVSNVILEDGGNLLLEDGKGVVLMETEVVKQLNV